MTPAAAWIKKHAVSFSADRARGEACVEFKVGIRSAPYLADHGFQDMIVLPGSFYVELALSVERERSGRVPVLVRNVTFNNPILLSEEDPVIRVEARDDGERRVEYTFCEVNAGNGSSPLVGSRYAARLEIDQSPATSSSAATNSFSIAAFQAQSNVVIDSDGFYKKLRRNGNQYGPRFQKVSTIWQAGDQCLGRLSLACPGGEREGHCLHPSLLDSMTQLLAPFTVEKGKTFILRSIEKIEIIDAAFPDALWGHAALLEQAGRDEGVFVGNIRVFDGSGKPHVELSGVTFTLLDRVDHAEEKRAASVVIAANFTAEPIEDSLKFWGAHFGVPMHLEFAPYNQIFQQLLDSESAFRRNQDGVNIILLALEEWTGEHPPAVTPLSPARAKQCFGELPRHVLPNGLEIVHLNRYETDYLYQEIFEDRCYLRHGIRLRDGATVVDIGANIGLFSLFVMSCCANPRIYAFEPAPVVYDLLKANCDVYSSTVRALNVGVSDKPGTATLTFYEKSSVFSSFHADETEDRQAIQAVVRNTLHSGIRLEDESVEPYVNELTADRLRRKTHECRLTSVSDIIRDNRIDRIDLLKIDAEKSEWAILQGIGDDDWPKIDQLVIEIHDRTGEAVRRIEGLLIGEGYRCAVEQETLLERSGLFNLYATRCGAGDELHSQSENAAAPANGTVQTHKAAASLQRNGRDLCAALRSFMTQAKVPLVLCFCPRSPSGEADAELKAALNDAEESLLAEAGRIANVHAISSASIFERYPVADYYDLHGDQAGHIPYTSECYAAIGTVLIRTLFKAKTSPSKVLVLDCDNTLWKGVCSEDGPLGIEMAPPYRLLQEFLIRQMHAGLLLCLCSKNEEKEVLDVFDQRTDMPLKREHFVAWRINWKGKSENVRSLAHELNLGLDSFIFMDDNPVECAEVRSHCPEALTLQLPDDTGSLPVFLNHIWAFDHSGATEEDRNRTRMYRENAKRHELRNGSPSLKDFVKGLQLRVELAEATKDQLGRISQLTFRTNQFNFTTLRRSESEIEAFLNGEGAHCLAVRVLDRFGDYGLAGVVMYETEADRYKVDTFLLSCRVLGRGVEHAVMSRLGQRAVEEGKRFIELRYQPTEKNRPAREFITSLGEPPRNESGASWAIPADHLAGVEYDPDEKLPAAQGSRAFVEPEEITSRSAWTFDVAGQFSERLQRIGESLSDIGRLAKAIEEHRLGKQPRAAVDANPGSALETALLNIWRKVLGRPQTGMNDNFFEAGGTSLRAVQVIALIKKELRQHASIVSLFECPTVSLLAAKLSGASGEARAANTTATAALRGERRRRPAVRQRASAT